MAPGGPGPHPCPGFSPPHPGAPALPHPLAGPGRTGQALSTRRSYGARWPSCSGCAPPAVVPPQPCPQPRPCVTFEADPPASVPGPTPSSSRRLEGSPGPGGLGLGCYFVSTSYLDCRDPGCSAFPAPSACPGPSPLPFTCPLHPAPSPLPLHPCPFILHLHPCPFTLHLHPFPSPRPHSDPSPWPHLGLSVPNLWLQEDV